MKTEVYQMFTYKEHKYIVKRFDYYADQIMNGFQMYCIDSALRIKYLVLFCYIPFKYNIVFLADEPFIIDLGELQRSGIDVYNILVI